MLPGLHSTALVGKNKKTKRNLCHVRSLKIYKYTKKYVDKDGIITQQRQRNKRSSFVF